MTRPQPLANFSSAFSNNADDSALTPRTPHSRTARLEGGFAKLQVSDADNLEGSTFIGQQQSAPLLHSSTSPRFTAGLKSSKKHREPFTAFQRLLLVFGVFLGGLLLIMLFMSWTRPGALHRYIGLKYNASQPIQQPAQPQEKLAHTTQATPTVIPLAQPPQIAPLPLAEPLHYFEECNKLMSGYHSHGKYWDKPHMQSEGMMSSDESKEEEGVCSGTITYMLDGWVGLAADLALMAQVAALARERNKTFFVDDTYWNRGKWLDHFEDVRVGQPGPEPGCRPPTKDFVGCPRTSKHWVVNSITAKFHLGHPFSDNYENPFKHELDRLKPMYMMAQESLDHTIVPNSQTRRLINLAKQEVSKGLSKHHGEQSIGDQHMNDNIYLGVHIRRGDKKPKGYKWNRKPIPIEIYTEAIPTTWNRLHNADVAAGNLPKEPFVYIASDSPAFADELMVTHRGPSYSLRHSVHPELKESASDTEYYQRLFKELPIAKRRTLTKGAIVDLALVTGLWSTTRDPILLDATICTVSSNFCRLAPVGLGWDDAFGDINDMGEVDKANRRWVDLDIQGLEIPIWEPFQLF